MKKRGAAILACILVLAFGLRFLNLGQESLWLDEGWSVKIAGQDFNAIAANATNDVHPPLYYTLLHFWMAVFGNSEFSIRFLSFIFAMLSVYLIYLIANRLYGQQTALVAAFLLSVSTYHIHYAREARMYALFVCLILASMYWFIRRLDKNDWQYDAAWYACSLLMIYTQVYSVFFMLLQNLWIVILCVFARRLSLREVGRWLVLQVLLVIGFLPWLRELKETTEMVQGTFWVKAPSLSSLIKSFIEYSGSSNLVLLCFAALVAVALVAPRLREGIAGLRDAVRIRFDEIEWALFLCLWVLIPTVLPFIVSRFAQPIYVTKSAIGASLGLYILAAYGFSLLRPPIVKIGMSVLLVFALGLTVRDYYSEARAESIITHQKEQWRELAQYVESHAQPGDLVLHDPPVVWNSTAYAYYVRRTDLINKPYPVMGPLSREKLKPGEPEILLKAVEGHDRVWFVLYKVFDRKRIPDILQSQFDLVEQKEFYHRMDVQLFQRKQS